MGEAASGRLQTRLLSPLSLSLESTRSQVPFPNLIRVWRPGGQSVICLLLGSQPPLRFSCGPPLSAPVSFPAPLLYPTLFLSFQPGEFVPILWSFLALPAETRQANALPVEINVTGQSCGFHPAQSGNTVSTLILWTHREKTLHPPADSSAIQGESLAHAWQVLRIFGLGKDCRKRMGPRTSGCSSINLQHKSELWDAVVAPHTTQIEG